MLAARMAAIVVAQLTPAVDGVRLTLHVLAAAVWVGGQITLAALVPTARALGEDAPRRMARAFSRISWPAYAVLVATGVWNVGAAHTGQPTAWQAVLGIKIAVVALAGLSAWLHGRARSRSGLAAWGAITSLTSLAALALGVFLAG
jgi:putative copper export protein